METPASPRELRSQYRSGVRVFRDVKLDRFILSDLLLLGCAFENVSFRHCTGELKIGESQIHTGDLGSTFLLEGSKFARVQFRDVDFSESTLNATFFYECSFTNCNFGAARLERVVFVTCSFENVSFSVARLKKTRFHDCSARNCMLGAALFLSSNVDAFCEFPQTHMFSGAPIIDWQSICLSSRREDLDVFLISAGWPQLLAHYTADCARALDHDILVKLMRSTFISYGGPDLEFARELQQALELNGVQTFLFARDAIPGERLHRTMYEGVNKYDRVVLICSEASLNRRGVRNEIEETLAREAREGGASYLIPITRDDYLFRWDEPLAARLLDRVVADFRGLPVGDMRSSAAFRQLLRALRVENMSGAREGGA